jgi:hypothetical protein
MPCGSGCGAKALEKEYYRAVWDDKASGNTKDLQACLPMERGGVPSRLLRPRHYCGRRDSQHGGTGGVAIRPAIETAPAATMLREAVVRPWLQKSGYASRLPDEIRGVYTRWKRLVGN